MSGKYEQLKQIRDEIVNLKDSPLYEYRTANNYFPVIGEGSHDANVMFIGEAPGKNEAEQGRPFCGAAGKVLDELLASIGVDRKAVYVTNIVKDRPPMNRDPFPDEIELYAPFLVRQIDIIQPKVIATLGRFSMKYILEMFKLPVDTISRMHGKAFEADSSYGKVNIVPLYHPATALYGTSRDELKKDFQVLKRFV